MHGAVNRNYTVEFGHRDHGLRFKIGMFLIISGIFILDQEMGSFEGLCRISPFYIVALTDIIFFFGVHSDLRIHTLMNVKHRLIFPYLNFYLFYRFFDRSFRFTRQ